MSIWKFQVGPLPHSDDPRGRQALRTLADFAVRSVTAIRTSRLFLIELAGPAADQRAQAARIAAELLTDPVVETCTITAEGDTQPEPPGVLPVEVYLKPGVMDNVAESTAFALADMGIKVGSVRTGRRYDLRPIPHDRDTPLIRRLLGNDCVERVVLGTEPIAPPPKPAQRPLELCHVAIRNLEEPDLQRMSRDCHLFLSTDEMQTIRDHFRREGRDPTDLELETLAQTWSEHCVHKTLKSAMTYHGAPFPSADNRLTSRIPSSQPGTPDQQPTATVRYQNLLKDTIIRATEELRAEGRGPRCLSVFADNAGIIAFDDDFGIAFKVETHNHPSAIEPYGGAATGLGGVIRDILGCGLGAKPIANTDVFCVAPPDWPVDRLPSGTIHPRTILKGVVAGVRDYGNRMGIPTVNGAVHFDPRYLANPLVFCGCVGLIPRDRIEKQTRPGDAIVLLGGRTGRDGIHGATFSSAALTSTHTEEFAHAVQIGNPIEEKKVLDVILQARDYPKSRGLQPARPNKREDLSADANPTPPNRCLFSSITDCGAGGLSSAVGEMGQDTGAEVWLDRVPLKYPGLRYDEIWISEAQERMVLAVPEQDVDALLALARSEDVEATVIGRFTDTRRLLVKHGDTVVGDIDMAFLHDGLPKTTKSAQWWPATSDHQSQQATPTRVHPNSPVAPPSRRCVHGRDAHATEVLGRDLSPVAKLKQHLSDPNTASKHWIIRQYDHEVQGGSVVKPLVGPNDGPSDAAVVRPRLDGNRGIALGNGMTPTATADDPYWKAVAAIDEAIRNVVCVGGDPQQTAILDNFCWPSADDPQSLGALVRTCQACYDVAKAYGIPFISGKDSLNNVFTLSDEDAATLAEAVKQYDGPTAAQLQEQLRQDPRRLSIPYTLLISAVAIVQDVNRCITSVPQLVNGEAGIFMVAHRAQRWEALHEETAYHALRGADSTPCGTGFQPVRSRGPQPEPHTSDSPLRNLAKLHHLVADLIRNGKIIAAHDCSEGGIATAIAEMAIASGLDTEFLAHDPRHPAWPFHALPSCYLVQPVEPEALAAINAEPNLVAKEVARMKAPQNEPMFTFNDASADPCESLDHPTCVALSELRAAWQTPLDW